MNEHSAGIVLAFAYAPEIRRDVNNMCNHNAAREDIDSPKPVSFE